MDRGGAWDESINKRLSALYGLEKFDAKKISLSWDERKKIFLPFIKKIKAKIITVAGTNGKGETARLIHGHLKAKSYKVALWTSPHILSVRERIIFDGEMIQEADFISLLTKYESLKLSYYEALFLIFCDWASNKKEADFIVLEVGLGGRLDSTNFFDTDLVCLTSISRDHCEILGSELHQILKEKLGVCREGVPLISGLIDPKLRRITREESVKLDMELLSLSEIRTSYNQMAYWQQNMLISLVAARLALGFCCNAEYVNKLELLAPQESPGRFDQVTLKNRRFIFIGAHNLDGLKTLLLSIFDRLGTLENLQTLFAVSKRPLVDISEMIDLLNECEEIKVGLKICDFNHTRAMNKDDLQNLLKQKETEGKGKIEFVHNCFENLSEDIEGTTLVLGSYYFIGEFQKYLSNNMLITFS